MRISARLLVVAVSLGSSLILGEWVSRVQYGHPNPLPIDPHEQRSFWSRPLSKGTFPVRLDESRYLYVPYTTSTLGLRDREYASKKPGDVRVALLGDSMTMGWGLLDHETVARRLESMLPTISSARRVEVINAGQFGYGPIQELNLLKETVGLLKPDIVVLQLFMSNDVADSARAAGFRLRSHDLETLIIDQLISRNSILCYRVNRWLRDNSRAYQIIARAVGRPAPICFSSLLRGSLPAITVSPNEPRPHWLEVNLRRWYPEIEKGWELTKVGIRGIRNYCDERGIEFFVYVQPALLDLSPEQFRSAVVQSTDPEAYEYRKGIRLAEEFFREEGIRNIDVQLPLLTRVEPDLAFYLWDGHLTPLGAQEVARAISIALRGASEVFAKRYLE